MTIHKLDTTGGLLFRYFSGVSKDCYRGIFDVVDVVAEIDKYISTEACRDPIKIAPIDLCVIALIWVKPHVMAVVRFVIKELLSVSWVLWQPIIVVFCIRRHYGSNLTQIGHINHSY